MDKDFESQFQMNMDDMFKSFEAFDAMKDFKIDVPSIDVSDFGFHMDTPGADSFGESFSGFDFSADAFKMPELDFGKEFKFDFSFDFEDFEKKLEKDMSKVTAEEGEHVDASSAIEKSFKKQRIKTKASDRLAKMETAARARKADLEIRIATQTEGLRNWTEDQKVAIKADANTLADKLICGYYSWAIVWDQLDEEKSLRKLDKITDRNNRNKSWQRN